jgi:hypothetical protein
MFGTTELSTVDAGQLPWLITAAATIVAVVAVRRFAAGRRAIRDGDRYAQGYIDAVRHLYPGAGGACGRAAT